MGGAADLEQGCQVQKQKTENLAVSSFKKVKSSKMNKRPNRGPIFFTCLNSLIEYGHIFSTQALK